MKTAYENKATKKSETVTGHISENRCIEIMNGAEVTNEELHPCLCMKCLKVIVGSLQKIDLV